MERLAGLVAARTHQNAATHSTLPSSAALRFLPASEVSSAVGAAVVLLELAVASSIGASGASVDGATVEREAAMISTYEMGKMPSCPLAFLP